MKYDEVQPPTKTCRCGQVYHYSHGDMCVGCKIMKILLDDDEEFEKYVIAQYKRKLH